MEQGGASTALSTLPGLSRCLINAYFLHLPSGFFSLGLFPLETCCYLCVPLTPSGPEEQGDSTSCWGPLQTL